MEPASDMQKYYKRLVNPLHAAVIHQDIQMIELFLKAGIHVDTRRTHDNCTPLHIACLYGKLNIVEFLLEHGADIEAKNDTNYTPLGCGARSYMIKLILKLLKY